MLGTISLAFAVCFSTFAAFGWPTEGRVKFGWLSLLLLEVAILLGPIATIPSLLR